MPEVGVGKVCRGFFLSVAQYRRNLEQARLRLQRFTGFRDLRQFSLPAQVSFSGIMGANREKVLRFQLCDEYSY